MIPFPEVLLRLAHAMLLGGLVGLERQQRNRPAGLRTHLLVALASATFMLVSVDFLRFQHFAAGRGITADPSRIASYVVAGLGFLGAGTIIRGRGGVQGITTAATLWMVSALGLATGAGMLALAWAATLAALFALEVLRLVERRLDRFRSHQIRRRVGVELVGSGVAGRAEVLAQVEAIGCRVAREQYDRHAGTGCTLIGLDIRLTGEDQVEPLLRCLEDLPGVRRVTIGHGAFRPDGT